MHDQFAWNGIFAYLHQKGLVHVSEPIRQVRGELAVVSVSGYAPLRDDDGEVVTEDTPIFARELEDPESHLLIGVSHLLYNLYLLHMS